MIPEERAMGAPEGFGRALDEWREEMKDADPAWHGFRVLRAMDVEKS